eukprot:scaffold706_cov418-Prasinococcus_capsulatus_cf.AAC.39
MHACIAPRGSADAAAAAPRSPAGLPYVLSALGARAPDAHRPRRWRRAPGELLCRVGGGDGLAGAAPLRPCRGDIVTGAAGLMAAAAARCTHALSRKTLADAGRRCARSMTWAGTTPTRLAASRRATSVLTSKEGAARAKQPIPTRVQLVPRPLVCAHSCPSAPAARSPGRSSQHRRRATAGMSVLVHRACASHSRDSARLPLASASATSSESPDPKVSHGVAHALIWTGLQQTTAKEALPPALIAKGAALNVEQLLNGFFLIDKVQSYYDRPCAHVLRRLLRAQAVKQRLGCGRSRRHGPPTT